MIPTPSFRIPPPAKRKSLWERYIESFDTKPSAEKSILIKNVYHPAPPPPPRPQEPRRVNYGKLDKSDKLIFYFGILIFVLVAAIAIYNTINPAK